MTELVVFERGRAAGGWSVRESDLPDPRVAGRGDDGRRRRRQPRRAVGLDALTQGRPRGGGAPGGRLAVDLDRVLDLRVLDLELEGAGQGRGQVERQPRRQEQNDPASAHEL